jgi:hypothetical protein
MRSCEWVAVARLLYFLAAIGAGQVSKLERDAGTPPDRRTEWTKKSLHYDRACSLYACRSGPIGS